MALETTQKIDYKNVYTNKTDNQVLIKETTNKNQVKCFEPQVSYPRHKLKQRMHWTR